MFGSELILKMGSRNLWFPPLICGAQNCPFSVDYRRHRDMSANIFRKKLRQVQTGNFVCEESSTCPKIW